MATATITTPACMACDKTSTVEVTVPEFKAWQAGVPIQNVFPQMSADERELLMTGTHGECWDAMFGEE